MAIVDQGLKTGVVRGKATAHWAEVPGSNDSPPRVAGVKLFHPGFDMVAELYA